MGVQWTPMRWPGSWKDPGLLALLNGTAIDCLLVEKREDLGPVRRKRHVPKGVFAVDTTRFRPHGDIPDADQFIATGCQ